MNKFLLLTYQRSGSTFTRLLLNSHPDIRLYSEIFHTNYRPKDGFKHFCESRFLGAFWYRQISAERIRGFARNAIINKRDPLVADYLKTLEHDPTFPLPWTNIKDESWLGDQAPASSEPCKALGFQLMFSR